MDQLLKDLDKAIKSRNLTRRQAAIELGFHEATFSRWFNGKAAPRSESIRNKLRLWIEKPGAGAYVVVVIDGVRYAGTIYPEGESSI